MMFPEGVKVAVVIPLPETVYEVAEADCGHSIVIVPLFIPGVAVVCEAIVTATSSQYVQPALQV